MYDIFSSGDLICLNVNYEALWIWSNPVSVHITRSLMKFHYQYFLSVKSIIIFYYNVDNNTC